MKPTIGFVGLGEMGKWMALNLLKKGFPLNFFARKKEVIETMSEEGGKYLPSLKGLAKESDWVIFCLSDTEAVEAVLFGKDGMAEELKPGKIVIDCGTIHPLPTRRFAEILKGKGIPFLDAPISGMEARAKAGTLTIMVGGEKEIFEKAKPVFEAMGNKIIYAGISGNGQLMKMINQVMFDIHCATIAELLPLAVKMGLDAVQTFEVVRTGTGQCFAVDNFGPLILDRNFGPGYPLEEAYKDMVHVSEISSAHRVCVRNQQRPPGSSPGHRRMHADVSDGLGSRAGTGKQRGHDQGLGKGAGSRSPQSIKNSQNG
ncbi:MAG: beta-hydroxyacid dehydrogenase, 3-hydroxyisobutyrate dehydrogenase [Deltaproteobacteria bacterium]|nr:beta-hydroxyacid dehydrogenase, 3-hydroxyisobutyrate dehydrogenase [Deltaproteobacteria bacterium]